MPYYYLPFSITDDNGKMFDYKVYYDYNDVPGDAAFELPGFLTDLELPADGYPSCVLSLVHGVRPEPPVLREKYSVMDYWVIDEPGGINLNDMYIQSFLDRVKSTGRELSTFPQHVLRKLALSGPIVGYLDDFGMTMTDDYKLNIRANDLYFDICYSMPIHSIVGEPYPGQGMHEIQSAEMAVEVQKRIYRIAHMMTSLPQHIALQFVTERRESLPSEISSKVVPKHVHNLIRLTTNDGKNYELPIRIAWKCLTLRHMLEDCDKYDGVSIPINVTGEAFELFEAYSVRDIEVRSPKVGPKELLLLFSVMDFLDYDGLDDFVGQCRKKITYMSDDDFDIFVGNKDKIDPRERLAFYRAHPDYFIGLYRDKWMDA
jgi:hypothetical protein